MEVSYSFITELIDLLRGRSSVCNLSLESCFYNKHQKLREEEKYLIPNCWKIRQWEISYEEPSRVGH